jgi:hypothetical protein
MPNHIFPDGMPDGKVQYDAGMSGGCAWKPFTLTEDAYEELRLDLLTDPELHLVENEPPPEVTRFKQWLAWCRKHGTVEWTA